MTRVALAVAASLLGCATPPASPPHKPVTHASAGKVSAIAAPTTSANTEAPTTDGPPIRKVAFHLVIRSDSLPVQVWPFDGGAVLGGRSLLAIVDDETVVQDPTWLRGFPEYINWDGGWHLDPRRDRPAPTTAGLPPGTLASTGAGNLRGPSDAFEWNGKRWMPHPGLLDARIHGLGRTGLDVTALSHLPSGDLVALCTNSQGTEYTSHHFPPRSTQAAAVHPLPANAAYGKLVGHTATDLHVCSTHGVWKLQSGGWETVPLPDEVAPTSCALQQSGTLWVKDLLGEGALFMKKTTTWERVPIPGGAQASEVAAGGDRIWLKAHSLALGEHWLSTKPVATPLHITEEVFSQADLQGMSGLNNVGTIDVPSVSRAPAGPATEACTSLVVYLGGTLTRVLRKKLKAHTDTRDLELVRVAATVPGKLVPRPRGGVAAMGLKPSGKTRRAHALLAPDLATARRARQAVDQDLEPARVICAVPDITKRLK